MLLLFIVWWVSIKPSDRHSLLCASLLFPISLPSFASRFFHASPLTFFVCRRLCRSLNLRALTFSARFFESLLPNRIFCLHKISLGKPLEHETPPERFWARKWGLRGMLQVSVVFVFVYFVLMYREGFTLHACFFLRSPDTAQVVSRKKRRGVSVKLLVIIFSHLLTLVVGVKWLHLLAI